MRRTGSASTASAIGMSTSFARASVMRALAVAAPSTSLPPAASCDAEPRAEALAEGEVAGLGGGAGEHEVAEARQPHQGLRARRHRRGRSAGARRSRGRSAPPWRSRRGLARPPRRRRWRARSWPRRRSRRRARRGGDRRGRSGRTAPSQALRERRVAAGERHGGGQAARHVVGEARAGQHGDGRAGAHLLHHVAEKGAAAALDALGAEHQRRCGGQDGGRARTSSRASSAPA